jgi:hypothetical protein
VNTANFEILLAIIGAAAGALFGSLSSILFGLIASRQQERKALVLELYQEYNSLPLLDDRMKVSEFLKKRQGGISYNDIRVAFENPSVKTFGGVTPEQFAAFRRMSLFFEKVHNFKSNRYLNKKLASAMIGIYVCGWARNGWLDFINDSVGDPTETFMYRNQHFRELYEWFGCGRQTPPGDQSN